MKDIKTYSEFINEEIDFKMKPVDYTESIKTVLGKDTIIYTFVTKNDEYSIYFSNTEEQDHILSDNSRLYDYCDGKDIPTIFFSLSNRGLSDDFDNLTGYNEGLTILSHISYLINEYDRKYNRPVYSIGYVDPKKEKFYMYFLHNLEQFKILKGKSNSYVNSGAYYLIKK